MNKISKAKLSDIPEIIQVQKQTWLATYPNKDIGITKEDITKRLGNPGDEILQKRIENWQNIINNLDKQKIIFIAKENKKIVGFAIITNQEKPTVSALYVLPNFQGQGVGKLLLQKSFDWLGNQPKIFTYVASYNQKAIDFYKKHGFQATTETPKDEFATKNNLKPIPTIEMVFNIKKIYAVYCIVKLTKQPNWLDDFRKKYDEAYDFHITLKQAAYIEESHFSEIKEMLDGILNEFVKTKRKITLTFDKLLLDEGEKKEESGYIYLFSENNDLIDDLQTKIRNELIDYSDYLNPKSIDYEYDFKPHITIARGLVGDRFNEAVAELKKDYKCEGEITEVILSCVKEISVGEAHNPNNLTEYKI